MIHAMSTRTSFQDAIPNPQRRREIALALGSGIPAEQWAAEFNISETTSEEQ